MVWGMNLPSGFGEFWPSGQFEGAGKQTGSNAWAERLRDHYYAQSDEEQKRLLDERVGGRDANGYAYYVSKKFISELGSEPVEPDVPVITPIEPHEPPQFFQTRKGQKNLASLISLSSRIVAVDEDLKLIIERLESAIHGFFPIDIRMPLGKIYPKTYYTLVIGQYFDSISQENSAAESLRKNGEYRYFRPENKKQMAGVALRKDVFGSAHLWRERRFKEWITCFSDELVAVIAEAGLRIPRHYKMKEV